VTEYYVQVLNNPIEADKFWKVDEHGDATRIDVVTSDRTFRAVNFLKDFPGTYFHKLRLAPGEYFPRMARPSDIDPKSSPGWNPDKSGEISEIRATSTGQLHALIGQLEQICRVIHPTPKNDGAFGHEIRNILILACTEAEAQWKGILKANGVEKKKTTTNDYILLAEPMRLYEYKVELTYYPWLDPIVPFEGWRRMGSPTKDLGWYHAYNLVKHDREANFERATLRHALQAVAGCFVILCAQYGWDFASRGPEAFRAFFRLKGAPVWPPSEIYVPFGAPRERQYEFIRE
jgi:hypothetical protein